MRNAEQRIVDSAFHIPHLHVPAPGPLEEAFAGEDGEEADEECGAEANAVEELRLQAVDGKGFAKLAGEIALFGWVCGCVGLGLRQRIPAAERGGRGQQRAAGGARRLIGALRSRHFSLPLAARPVRPAGFFAGTTAGRNRRPGGRQRCLSLIHI